MFKVGDKVVCVDATGANHSLRCGQEYVVTEYYLESSVGYISVDYCSGWSPNRFVLASEYSAQDQLTNETKTALDIQHGGGHYKGMKIQPVEFIHANNIGYMEGNAIKYLCRWQLKNGLEDLNKAKHYIELLIQMENERESKN